MESEKPIKTEYTDEKGTYTLWEDIFYKRTGAAESRSGKETHELYIPSKAIYMKGTPLEDEMGVAEHRYLWTSDFVSVPASDYKWTMNLSLEPGLMAKLLKRYGEWKDALDFSYEMKRIAEKKLDVVDEEALEEWAEFMDGFFKEYISLGADEYHAAFCETADEVLIDILTHEED